MSELRKSFLMFGLGCLSECLCHDFALAEEESTGASPLRSDLLETIVAHVSYAKNPNMVILINGGAELSDESSLGLLGGPQRGLGEGGDLGASGSRHVGRVMLLEGRKKC